ncbi:hypothetical protein Patl1_33256 [Pistacia atlantica]|uniref:Uncharacterized protein n=1 Tax=Pistacia atlantica TaxID=434234 RepID=A0ACC1AQ29_9ROSI|nr:hypothetical protein Patl1_33256 [Pistacia atlantica]
MTQKSTVTYNTMISAFARNGRISDAFQLFEKIPRKNMVSWQGNYYVACWNAMISGYAKKRKFDDAKKLFDAIPAKNIVSWNSMLSGYTKNGEMSLAMKFFEEMEEHNMFSWNLMLDEFVEVDDLDSTWKIPNAELVFKDISQVDVVSWNSLIAGYAFNGCGKEAIKLFEETVMEGVAADQVTFIEIRSTGQISGTENLLYE